MNKEEFIKEMRQRLSYLPEAEVEKSVAFYSESIDDRVEDGMEETAAVEALGSMDEIIRDIELSLPLKTVVGRRVRESREKQAKSGTSVLWVVLAIVGSPVWLPILLAVIAVVAAVYISVWAVIVSLIAVVLALAVSGLAAVIYSVFRLITMGAGAFLMGLGAAAACVGLFFLLLTPVVQLSKLLVKLTVSFGRWIKSLFITKGGSGK